MIQGARDASKDIAADILQGKQLQSHIFTSIFKVSFPSATQSGIAWLCHFPTSYCGTLLPDPDNNNLPGHMC